MTAAAPSVESYDADPTIVRKLNGCTNYQSLAAETTGFVNPTGEARTQITPILKYLASDPSDASGIGGAGWDVLIANTCGDRVVAANDAVGTSNHRRCHDSAVSGGTTGATGNSIDYRHTDLYLNIWINEAAGGGNDVLLGGFGDDDINRSYDPEYKYVSVLDFATVERLSIQSRGSTRRCAMDH